VPVKDRAETRHLWAHEDEDRATRDRTALSPRPDIPVRADSPPTFLLQAEDDPVDTVEESLAYYVALQFLIRDGGFPDGNRSGAPW
jgi:hypothetical protein